MQIHENDLCDMYIGRSMKMICVICKESGSVRRVQISCEIRSRSRHLGTKSKYEILELLLVFCCYTVRNTATRCTITKTNAKGKYQPGVSTCREKGMYV